MASVKNNKKVDVNHRWLALASLSFFVGLLIQFNPYFPTSDFSIILLGVLNMAFILYCISKSIRRPKIYNAPKRSVNARTPDYMPTTSVPLNGRVTQRIKLGDILEPATGNPLFVSDKELNRHMVIVGQSGSGKTIGIENILWQQIRRGGGGIFIDGKLDGDTCNKMKQMCLSAGRIDDFLIINPNNPPTDSNKDDKTVSHTYNPLLKGDVEAVVNRIMSAQSGGGAPSATSEHFQAMNKAGLTFVIEAIKCLDLAFTFEDLGIILSSPIAMQELWRMLPKDSREKIGLATYLEGMTVVNNFGQREISSKKFMDNLGGIAARMQTLASGNLGMIMNTYCPQVDLFDCITGNKILYVMLPSMEKLTTTAKYLAQFLISDLQTAIAKVQEMESYRKPAIPYLLLFDEFGAYATYSSSVIWEQARSAGICAAAAFQTFSSLEALGVDFRNKIMGNSLIKIFYALRDSDSPKIASEMLGYMDERKSEMVEEETVDDETGEVQKHRFSKTAGSAQKVGANIFRELQVGQAIVSIERDIYKIMGPLVEGYELVNDNKSIDLTYRRDYSVKGLNFYKIWTKLLRQEMDFSEKPTMMDDGALSTND